MCEVVIADNAGFCFGVQRAIDRAYEQSGNNIYTYGSLIHNKEVMKDLSDRGIIKVDDIEKFKELTKGTVIIRSHGITEKEEIFLEKCGHDIIDTTCPYVKRIHKLVNKASKEGYQIIIIGNPTHPEIKGVIGWCASAPIVVENEEEAEKFVMDTQKCGLIVAQTTFNLLKFHKLVEIISKKGYNVNVKDTICQATEDRQIATEKLAKVADVMIVVGDKQSSNTQKLFEISMKECTETYFVQTTSDMNFEKLVGKKLVGITAGASTPKKIIEEVSENARSVIRRNVSKRNY